MSVCLSVAPVWLSVPMSIAACSLSLQSHIAATPHCCLALVTRLRVHFSPTHSQVTLRTSRLWSYWATSLTWARVLSVLYLAPVPSAQAGQDGLLCPAQMASIKGDSVLLIPTKCTLVSGREEEQERGGHSDEPRLQPLPLHLHHHS